MRRLVNAILAVVFLVMQVLVGAIGLAIFLLRRLPGRIERLVWDGYYVFCVGRRKAGGEPTWKPIDWSYLGKPPPPELHEKDCRAHVKQAAPTVFCHCAIGRTFTVDATPDQMAAARDALADVLTEQEPPRAA